MLRKGFSTSQSSSYAGHEDVDDDMFLKNSTQSLSPYGEMSSNSFHSANKTFSLEDQRTQILNRQKEIECKALESTQRSLNMLRDSEEVGILTAEELARQREQLENTNDRLSEINENLHSSSKHIQGISSIFGSLKNYWSNRKSSKEKETDHTADRSTRSVSMDASTSRSKSQLHKLLERAGTNINPEDHPAMRLKGISSSQDESFTGSTGIHQILDRNLDEMSGALARLKGLAEGLGQEIDSQNHLLEDVISKTEKADINIDKQNKDINRLLRK